MKHTLYALSFLLLFFIMLFFPSETLLGASNGLLLWFQILIPTLLPFLILTNILIRTNAIKYVVRFVGPAIQKLFRVSANGSFAVLSGFLCGYPIGAKVTADLVKRNQISLSEGNYLLSFCNNTSPAFISGYVILQQLQEPSLLVPSIMICYLSPYLCSFVFRRYYRIRKQTHTLESSHTYFHFQILDDSIMNAFETITKIGGYIILFSIIFILGKHTPFHIFLPLLEITSGIPYILSRFTSFSSSYILIMGLTSFGGICSIAQTNSVIQGSNLSITSYTIEKLITALVTSLLTFLYVMIIVR